MSGDQDMTGADKSRVIATRDRPGCYLCGERGEPLYEGLHDRLFGAPGRWNLKCCPKGDCGLIWLDPMPTEEDIGKVYSTYYTHRQAGDAKPAGSGKLTTFIRRALYKPLLRVLRVRKGRKRLKCMCLDRTPAGKLLEVGCGDGKRLARMRALGWDVLGQEIDPAAAAYACRSWGVDVHVGRVQTLEAGPEIFDAVIMNHVIEHVYDPVALLAACRRLLKSGGKLILATPNSASYGHCKFGACWRGLEPPRHLHLFSSKTLSQVAYRAGFSHQRCWTTPVNAEGIGRDSLSRACMSADHNRLNTMRGEWRGMLFQFAALTVFLSNKDSGEECVMVATK